MTAPTPPGRRTWLVTGVTGFLGKVLLEELLRRRESLGIARILVVVRPLRGHGGQERFDREVATSPCFSRLTPGWQACVTVLEADLERDTLPDSLTEHPALADVTQVVHAAASIRFNLPLPQAARANVQATLSMLALARSLPRAERFVYVSTAYVTPHRAGPIAEEPVALPSPPEELLEACRAGTSDDTAVLARTGHPNTYTYTKAIAERLVISQRGRLPVTIVRPSAVTASRIHPFPGWIDSHAGFAGFIKLIAVGWLRAMEADPDARLDVVPVDDVARRIVDAAIEGGPPVAVRHLTVGPAKAPTVRQGRDITQRYFRMHPPREPRHRPRSMHLGPRDLRFQMIDFVMHHLPQYLAGLRSPTARRRAAKMRNRLRMQIREFSYFTTRTFDFVSSMPIDATYDPLAFVESVNAGVREHLLEPRS